MSKSTALSASEIMMRDINIDEALWASNMLPEGIVERWFIADGTIVACDGFTDGRNPESKTPLRQHGPSERSSDNCRGGEHCC